MNTNINFERLDSCYGAATGSCTAGASLTLENGQEAFAYSCANLLPGTIVLCTVLRMPTDEKRMLVSFDSVCGYATMAA